MDILHCREPSSEFIGGTTLAVFAAAVVVVQQYFNTAMLLSFLAETA